MNLEMKVGMFVLLALLVTGVSTMKLGNIRFEKRYTLYFIFEDIQGFRKEGPIKIAGVEIGQSAKIELEKGMAKITGRIRSDVVIYANAKAVIQQTGVIGTQYVDVDPGTPEAPQLKDGDTLYGEKSKSLNDLIAKLSEVIEGKEGETGVASDLKTTMRNLRSITDSLNAAIGLQRNELIGMVKNLHQFTVDLKGAAADIHGLTTAKKEDIEVALTKLRSLLERLDDIVAKVQQGEGAVGRLIADKEMGEEVKKTVSNLKATSESAKEVLGRFTKVRSFWELQLRAVPGASTARGDGGIRLQPREHKYYYLGINNAGNFKDEYKSDGDYEKKNTITAVIGKEFGPMTFEAGALRSTAGMGLKYYPFRDRIAEEEERSWLRNIELNAQAFDFARDEVRGRAGKERSLKGPHFNLGTKYRLNRYINLGASVEDLAEIRQYNVVTHLIFEDRDLAYLFGFVSFAR